MIFHLAIPAKDLTESEAFYVSLGAKVGRKNSSQVILKLFSTQLVLHLSDKYDEIPTMYPRHFGCIIASKTILEFLWKQQALSGRVFEPYFVRHEGLPEEHHTFFLKDPSNNLVEFKWYKNQEKVFG